MTESHHSPERGSKPRRPEGSAAEKAQKAQKAQQEKVQKQLDEALADSFPASDPVSIVTSHQEEDEDPPESER